MHYIAGTSFTVAQKILTGDKRFRPGLTFSLISISKKDNKVLYTFLNSLKEKIQVEFKSCREADLFISKFKNEKLPNYEKVEDNIIDTISD
jgi:hypothetical protein